MFSRHVFNGLDIDMLAEHFLCHAHKGIGLQHVRPALLKVVRNLTDSLFLDALVNRLEDGRWHDCENGVTPCDSGSCIGSDIHHVVRETIALGSRHLALYRHDLRDIGFKVVASTLNCDELAVICYEHGSYTEVAP